MRKAVIILALAFLAAITIGAQYNALHHSGAVVIAKDTIAPPDW